MADPVRARRLSDHEGQRLTQIVRRGRGTSIRVRRATMILASASGTSVAAIARLVAADEDTVRDVVHAFNERGLAALDPQWAGGRPRLISDDDIAFITRDGHHPTHRCRGSVHALEPAQTRRPPRPQLRPTGADRSGTAASGPARARDQLPTDPDLEGLQGSGQGSQARPNRERDQPLPDAVLRVRPVRPLSIRPCHGSS